MATFEIPLLTAPEIECRVGQVSKQGKGCSILLYKDARCDMAILDELFTPLGWKREHIIRENVINNLRTMVNYCKVSIWNEDIGEWVSKEDVGTESNTENAKGEASDAFKRACVNWGIGRELYTAPFIWINPITPGEEFKYAKFKVTHIAYNEKREISQLIIHDDKNRVRFSYGVQQQPAQAAPQAPQQPIAPPTLQPLTDVDYDAPTPQDIAKVLAHLDKVRSRADLTKVCTPMMGKAIMQIADVVAKCTEIGQRFPRA